jgi:hypothetical protein
LLLEKEDMVDIILLCDKVVYDRFWPTFAMDDVV